MAKEPFTIGQKDPQVKALQQFLNQAGYPVAKTGPGSVGFETDYYGPLTQSATQKYLASGGNLALINPQTGGVEPLPYKSPIQFQPQPQPQPIIPSSTPQYAKTPQPPLATLTEPPVAPTPPTTDEMTDALLRKIGYSGTEKTPIEKRQEYLDFLTGQRKTYGEELGVAGKEATAQVLRTRVDETNKMLDDLEANINERVKGLGAGESWRQRMVAYERAPLTKQLGELGRAYAPAVSEVQTSRQKFAELMGESQQAYAYGEEKTPQQQLAEKIAEQQALERIKPPSYTQVSPGETLYDQKTGKVIYTAPAKPTEPKYQEVQGGLYDITNQKWIIQPKTTPQTNTQINQKLFNVGLSPTAVSNVGKITDSNLGKLGLAGIPPDTAQGIMDEILKGTTLEELRQYFRSKGIEMINGKPIMDVFMQTIQGVSAGGGEIEEQAGGDLEKVIEELNQPWWKKIF